jgi:hypothetical protein
LAAQHFFLGYALADDTLAKTLAHGADDEKFASTLDFYACTGHDLHALGIGQFNNTC